MAKLKKVWGYAPQDFSGKVSFVEHCTEKTPWGKEQDTLVCVGEYLTELEGKVVTVPFGNVAISRHSLVNQIIKECGDDTEKYNGLTFVFDKGKLLKVIENVA